MKVFVLTVSSDDTEVVGVFDSLDNAVHCAWECNGMDEEDELANPGNWVADADCGNTRSFEEDGCKWRIKTCELALNN
jgi:hypothetical protein